MCLAKSHGMGQQQQQRAKLTGVVYANAAAQLMKMIYVSSAHQANNTADIDSASSLFHDYVSLHFYHQERQSAATVRPRADRPRSAAGPGELAPWSWPEGEERPTRTDRLVPTPGAAIGSHCQTTGRQDTGRTESAPVNTAAPKNRGTAAASQPRAKAEAAGRDWPTHRLGGGRGPRRRPGLTSPRPERQSGATPLSGRVQQPSNPRTRVGSSAGAAHGSCP